MAGTDRQTVLRYDEQGSPVYQDDEHLADLWHVISKCGLEHSLEKDKFAPAEYYGPIGRALAEVDILLQCLKESKGSALLERTRAEPLDDSYKGDEGHEGAAALYLEAATRMKNAADDLRSSLSLERRCYRSHVIPLMAAEFPVFFLERERLWAVDYGYKHMWRHFEAHFSSVPDRGTFAVFEIDPSTDKLSYSLGKSRTAKRLVHRTNDTDYALPMLFDPSTDGLNDDCAQLIQVLSLARQSLLECDLYDHLRLSAPASDDAYVRLSESDTVWIVGPQDIGQRPRPSRLLLGLLREYLSGPKVQ